jgi:hypothetical protein
LPPAAAGWGLVPCAGNSMRSYESTTNYDMQARYEVQKTFAKIRASAKA